MSSLESPSKCNRYVVCKVGPTLYAINADDAVELVNSKSVTITKVPTDKASLAGMVTIRGRVMAAVDLRVAFGYESFTAEIREMTDFLKAREQDHVSWLEDLRKSIEKGKKFTKATDPTLCDFGQWYDSVAKNPAARHKLVGDHVYLASTLDAFDAPHRKIHALAEVVLAKAKAGEKEEAKALIEEAWDNELAKLRQLFKDFLNHYVSMRDTTMIVTEAGGEAGAIIVDEVAKVIEISEADIETIQYPVSVNGVKVVETCTKVGDDFIFLLHPGALVVPPIELEAAA